MGVRRVFQQILLNEELRWQQPSSANTQSPKRSYEDIGAVNKALLPLLTMGLVGVVWVGVQADTFGPVLLWSTACLAVGATVGFLFGIPRSSKEMARRSPDKNPAPSLLSAAPVPLDREGQGGRPNTNLEEVSDWLTKIIVGLTLVNLGEIETHVMAISRNAAASLHATPTNAHISAATALVVGFAVIGFLGGYLYTRLFLQGAFVRSDGDMQRYHEVVAEELSNVSVDPSAAGEPSIPSISDRLAAERVRKAVPLDHPDQALATLRELARQYESVRNAMPFGPERTRKMREIANGMKLMALGAAPFLPQLVQSPSPGERLAAVIVLQMKFDPAYIEWLANRLAEEPAFVGYQAASALLARTATVGRPEREKIKAAVLAVKDRIEPEAERDKLVQKLLAE